MVSAFCNIETKQLKYLIRWDTDLDRVSIIRAREILAQIETGEIKKPNEAKMMELELEAKDHECVWPDEDTCRIEARTGHAWQGSEADKIIVLVKHGGFFGRRWLYTALTRARVELVVIEEQGACKAMAENPEIRQTWLKAALSTVK